MHGLTCCDTLLGTATASVVHTVVSTPARMLEAARQDCGNKRTYRACTMRGSVAVTLLLRSVLPTNVVEANSVNVMPSVLYCTLYVWTH